MKIVLATRNEGKVSEMRRLLAGLNIDVVSARDYSVPEVVEDADTLEGNALKKAKALHEATRLPALADDTGLEVDALNGAPGIHSARYAGPNANDAANRARLLKALQHETNRTARFRTVLAYAVDGDEHYFEGTCEGTITHEERGDDGFGYDSVFIPKGEDRTFAEMLAEEKNAVSHRARAMRAFVDWFRSADSTD